MIFITKIVSQVESVNNGKMIKYQKL